MRELAERYMGNYSDRTAAASIGSVMINALFGVSKLVLGVYLLSAWFIINAVYDFVLCVARCHMLKKYADIRRQEHLDNRPAVEMAAYRSNGIFLCLLGVSYMTVCLYMYFTGDFIVQSGHAVFLVATVAFTKMGFAVYGIIITRKLKSPIVSALKTICIVDATVSIIITQCTLLTFCNVPGAAMSSAAFGTTASIAFIILGLCMRRKRGSSVGGCPNSACFHAEL